MTLPRPGGGAARRSLRERGQGGRVLFVSLPALEEREGVGGTGAGLCVPVLTPQAQPGRCRAV